jgi:3'-phosphoadenosine 5'-phosphosulfate sulfotransferase (PAPS reductase)/FAD synthetase
MRDIHEIESAVAALYAHDTERLLTLVPGGAADPSAEGSPPDVIKRRTFVKRVAEGTARRLRVLAELELAVARLTRPEREARVERLLKQAHALVDRAIADVAAAGRELAGIVTLFSGGNDSTTLAHIFKERCSHVGMANTGIGIEETRQYVRNTAAGWDLPVIEKHPEPGYGYRDLVLGRCRAKTGPNKGTVLWPGGFPGPGSHAMMYQRLKERAFEQIRNELVSNPYRQRVIFLGGRRATESNRRKVLALKAPIQRRGSVVWVAPLIHWTNLDLNTYRLTHPDVPRNRVSDLIHMSGECLCGAFAEENELDEIGMWFPAVKAEIEALEREVLASGAASPQRCRWGWGATKSGGRATGPSRCECVAA